MEIIKATEENFKNVTSEGFVLIDFYANWCGPCKMLMPVLEELATKTDDVKIVKVDVDESKELAREFKVKSIPNLTLLKDGELIHQELGLKTLEELQELIKLHQ